MRYLGGLNARHFSGLLAAGCRNPIQGRGVRTLEYDDTFDIPRCPVRDRRVCQRLNVATHHVDAFQFLVGKKAD
jgi:hypothetical protein